MTSTTSGDRVLVVEHNPTTRLGLTELERTWGFVAEAAAEGAEAPQRITVFRRGGRASDGTRSTRYRVETSAHASRGVGRGSALGRPVICKRSRPLKLRPSRESARRSRASHVIVRGWI